MMRSCLTCLFLTFVFVAINSFFVVGQDNGNEATGADTKTATLEALALIQTTDAIDAASRIDSIRTIYSEYPDSLKFQTGFELAQAYRKIHLYDRSIPVLEDMVRLSENVEDSINQSRALFYLGNSYKNIGLLNQALEVLYLALDIASNQQDYVRAAMTLSQIGTIKKEQKKTNEAISFFEKALSLTEELNDPSMSASVLNNIGSAYKHLGDYPRAKEYFLQAIQINKSINNLRYLSYNYNNLANVFEETGNLLQALDYQKKSIDIKTQLNDQPMLASSFYNLSIIHYKLDSLENSEALIIKSKALAKAYKVTAIIPPIYMHYSTLLSEKGDYARAYQLLSELNQFRDSLAQVNKTEMINELEAQYNRRNAIVERDGQSKENPSSLESSSQLGITVVLFGLCAGLLVLVFSLYYITYRKRTEDETALTLQKDKNTIIAQKLETQSFRLDELSKRVENLQRDKDIYFSSVSHDMRGPLNAINSIIYLFKQKEDWKDNEELVILDYSTRALNALVDDILDIAHLEAGRLKIEHKAFSLSEIIDELYDSFKFISDEKEVDLHLEVDDIPEHLVGDPRRLNQILFNLLENAFKFTKDGFVKLSASITANGIGQFDIRIQVEDTGIGIPRSKQELIFDKFYRGSAEAYKDLGGSGIGLFVSRALIQQMSGSLEVTSTLGEGSTFTISLTLPTDQPA